MSHLFPDEVKVDFDLFYSRVEHRVGGEVSSTKIITPKKQWSRLSKSEALEELTGSTWRSSCRSLGPYIQLQLMSEIPWAVFWRSKKLNQ
jgi:hypothetical protein